MDVSLQAKILRALQEKKIRRVGGTSEIAIDVRVVAATNRDLLKMTEIGTFREDLYYRLNVLSIEVPPLRERPSDLKALIEFFISKHAGSKKVSFSADARHLIETYPYPGNVRQLESAIERAVLLCEGDVIGLDDLPPEMVGTSTSARGTSVGSTFVLPEEGVNFEELEKSLIMQAMDRTDNNITKAAKLLGLTFRTLQYRLDKFGIKRD